MKKYKGDLLPDIQRIIDKFVSLHKAGALNWEKGTNPQDLHARTHTLVGFIYGYMSGASMEFLLFKEYRDTIFKKISNIQDEIERRLKEE